jgi:hypothetical protein
MRAFTEEDKPGVADAFEKGTMVAFETSERVSDGAKIRSDHICGSRNE